MPATSPQHGSPRPVLLATQRLASAPPASAAEQPASVAVQPASAAVSRMATPHLASALVQPASAAVQPLPSQLLRPTLQDTLIILDWDDTLMCSSAINANDVPPAVIPALELLVDSALKTSMRCGETIIVTSADESWVLRSARQFTPRVGPLVQQLYDNGRIISARRKYECSYPGDVFAWKREAFREVVDAKMAANGPGSGRGLNLVVVGDSPAEMEAAETSTQGVSPLLIKTVKFKVAPTAEEVVEQLRMVCQDLPSIVADDKNVARCLASNLRPMAPRQQAARPPGVQTTYSSTPASTPYSTSFGNGQATAYAGPQATAYAGLQAGYGGGRDGGHTPRVIYAACR